MGRAPGPLSRRTAQSEAMLTPRPDDHVAVSIRTRSDIGEQQGNLIGPSSGSAEMNRTAAGVSSAVECARLPPSGSPRSRPARHSGRFLPPQIASVVPAGGFGAFSSAAIFRAQPSMYPHRPKPPSCEKYARTPLRSLGEHLKHMLQTQRHHREHTVDPLVRHIRGNRSLMEFTKSVRRAPMQRLQQRLFRRAVGSSPVPTLQAVDLPLWSPHRRPWSWR